MYEIKAITTSPVCDTGVKATPILPVTVKFHTLLQTSYVGEQRSHEFHEKSISLYKQLRNILKDEGGGGQLITLK